MIAADPACSAFGQYLKVSEFNINSSAHLKQKKKLGQFLKNNTIDWQHITQDGVIELQKKLKHSLSLSYACKMITHLKAFLNFCVKKDYFSLYDLKKIDFMKTPKPKKRKSVISDSDISKILEFCHNKGDLDFMYYLLTLYFTGARPNEIIKITYKDIDFENENVSIWMNKTQRHKTVSLNKTFLNELMQLIKLNDLTNGCLFLGSIKHKEFYSKKFKELRQELQLPEHYTLYLFRHTAGTKALDFSQNIHLVQEFLGHEDIRTTQKYYMLDNPKRTKPLHDMLVDSVYQK